ncbi:hypothetical protein ANCCAN_15657 [Ancylostoma caninum]|uniref:Amino acid transporter transmembrane domain-containing protein n=1 Tax=Ancylostoma caninum TaxID=29170 RepID=A0A368G609_ANCCA|nr:hypothetical protein ANCCAN_15657 [Ancylostoma caninum]
MIRSSYALINLIKAMCGVGLFALPVAFQQAGLWTKKENNVAIGLVQVRRARSGRKTTLTFQMTAQPSYVNISHVLGRLVVGHVIGDHGFPYSNLLNS